MIGSIAGDIIGSVFEFRPHKEKEFPLFSRRCHFTDDTVLTVAIAQAILGDGDYLGAVLELGRKYPRAGYGGFFRRWLQEADPKPYNSWGNGSAMRVSPVAFAFDTQEEVLAEAARSAAISHNHPAGIKGAQATALAIFLARTTGDKEIIRREMADRFSYVFRYTLEEIRPSYTFDVSCEGSVPEAILAFLESTSYEDAIRNAVSLGGDADTQACIAGGIAEAFYGPVSREIAAEVQRRLTPDLWEITEEFCQRFPPHR